MDVTIYCYEEYHLPPTSWAIGHRPSPAKLTYPGADMAFFDITSIGN
jgi:hypothetical protein